MCGALSLLYSSTSNRFVRSKRIRPRKNYTRKVLFAHGDKDDARSDEIVDHFLPLERNRRQIQAEGYHNPLFLLVKLLGARYHLYKA